MDEWKKVAEEAGISDAKRRLEKYDYALKKHQRKYKCHVCGKPSSGPQVDYNSSVPPPFNVDWDRPTLGICQSCLKWTCEEHIHNNRCKNCCQGLLAGKSYLERKKIKSWTIAGTLLFLSLIFFIADEKILGGIIFIIGIFRSLTAFIDN